MRSGRPRGFDRDQAVDTAMRLFWRHGYEGVSLNDLTAAIGIAPPSLYAAFGSKAGLYREALIRYEALANAVDLSMLDELPTLDAATQALLEAAAEAVTRPERERGCMISNGMLATASEHDDLARELAERRLALRDAISGKLRRWLSEAEAASMARYLSAVLQGLSVQAKDGATLEELRMIIAHTVRRCGSV